MKPQLLNQNIELKYQPIFALYLWRQKPSIRIWVVILFISLIINNIHTALEYYFYSVQGIDWMQKKHFFEWVQWRYFLPFFITSLCVPLILFFKTAWVFQLRFLLLFFTLFLFFPSWYFGVNGFGTLFLWICLLPLFEQYAWKQK
ncbi:hypothetical protein [Acinetobacter sp.]|uniref:hypothetical protein n=1 Tax=Acinetobacter sp. TaxID=472 RepID=UPI00388E4056